MEEAAAVTGGDVLVLEPRDPSDFDGRAGGGGAAVDIEKQVPRWPEEGDRHHISDGDVLDLRPDQRVVRRRVPVAPTFDKQIGWRERQAAEAFDETERLQTRRGAWGWGEAGAEGAGAGGTGKGDDDPVERADRGRR